MRKKRGLNYTSEMERFYIQILLAVSFDVLVENRLQFGDNKTHDFYYDNALTIYHNKHRNILFLK